MTGHNVHSLHQLVFGTCEETVHSLAELGTILGKLSEDAKRLSEERASQCTVIPLGNGIPHPALLDDPDANARGQREANEALSKDVPGKVFDITAYRSRFVALEVIYVGWEYQGSTYQEGSPNSIEAKLFCALKRSRLISEDATLADVQFSRCGRTDRGVSARAQVMALKIRSKARLHEEEVGADNELDYARILNRNLPVDIHVTGWTDVPSSFDARFSTLSREYRYFVPCDGSLDLAGMQEAAKAFVGQHDFRNFCKVDAEHVHHFTRHILEFSIQPMSNCQFGSRLVMQIHIKGSAFLWHQVRCMVAVLLMVGKRQEQSSIVSQLLDVDNFGCKPQYNMADEAPLLFYACNFRNLHFHTSQASLERSLTDLDQLLSHHLAKAALLHCLVERIQSKADAYLTSTEVPAPRNKSVKQKHILLRNRGREPSLEAKFAKFGRVLDPNASSRKQVLIE